MTGFGRYTYFVDDTHKKNFTESLIFSRCVKIWRFCRECLRIRKLHTILDWLLIFEDVSVLKSVTVYCFQTEVRSQRSSVICASKILSTTTGKKNCIHIVHTTKLLMLYNILFAHDFYNINYLVNNTNISSMSYSSTYTITQDRRYSKKVYS